MKTRCYLALLLFASLRLAAQDQITTVDGQTYNVVLERIDENEFTIKTFSSRQYRNVPTDLVRSFYTERKEVVEAAARRVRYLAEMRVHRRDDKALSGDIAILNDPRYVVERTETYAELVALRTLDSVRVVLDSVVLVSRLVLMFDDGLGADPNRPIRDRAGRVRTFPSPVAALNYFNALGWRLVDTYDERRDSTYLTHYLLRRPIPEGQYQNVPR
ncbi:MAG: hypothetical protein WBA12_01730 [Catalinimonas sp.]